MSIVLLLLRNLVLTVLIEGALVLIFTQSKTVLYHSVLVNMLTNPLVNIFLICWASFVPLPAMPFYALATAFAEISAVIAEDVLYYKMGDFGLKKAFFASLFLNACSFGTGFIFN